MGFTPKSTTVKLNFSGSDLDGLTVITKSMTVGEYNAMIGSGASLSMLESNALVLDKFLDCLIEWDLEIPAGRPVPRTKKGCERVDSNVMSEILAAWVVALTSVPTKSPTQSRNGARPDRSVESTLGLGSLSESPGN